MCKRLLTVTRLRLYLSQALKYKSAQAFFDDVNSFVRKYLSHGDAVGPMKIETQLQEFLDRTVAQDAFLVRLGLAKRLGKEGLAPLLRAFRLRSRLHGGERYPVSYGDVQKFGSKLNSEVEMINQISVMDKKIDSSGKTLNAS